MHPSPQPLRFRNYRPADATLAPGAAAPAKEAGAAGAASEANGGAKGAGGKAAAPAKPPQEQQAEESAAGGGGKKKGGKGGPGEEEDVIKRELQRHLEEHGSEQLNVAPRKPNWDLKRDVAKKMEKLNRLTQKAVVELLREKLAREAEEGSSEDGSGSDEED